MSQFTIQVRYRPEHSDEMRLFNENGDDFTSITVTERESTITFSKHEDSSPDFTFASFVPSPDDGQFSTALGDGGRTMTVTDADTTSRTYTFEVCIYPNGDTSETPVCSGQSRKRTDQPPEIINQGSNP